MGIFQSLSSLYWLVSTLSILLISACLLTIFSFPSEFHDIGKPTRFAVLALAITNFLRVAMHRTDWALSRVNGHIVVLKDIVMRPGFATAFLATALIVMPTEPPHTVIPSCVAAKFMHGGCALLVVDVTLCLAIALIVRTVIHRIHSSAIATHGDGMVALPPQFVPAWAVGTVAEIDESLRARRVGSS
ncbi:hypothetical protein B0H13DRAFT_2348453 [Mycena leptocephala]|nr:hypothetical protein B0H13DRAFT_2348453 [Mycena leptocephala]